MNTSLPRVISFFVILLSAVFLTACDKLFSPKVDHFYGQTMGTSYTVSISALPKSISISNIKAEVQAVLDDVNQKMSTYKNDSEISLFNIAPENEWFDISQNTYDVVNEGLRLSEISHGAFDMTVGPIVNLWGFGPENQPEEVPDQNELNLLLQRVGFQYLHLHNNKLKIKKDKNIYLDLSAIAKGFAVDEVVKYLLTQGVENALIEIGGELRAIGQKEPGRMWRVAIETPTANMRSVQKIIELRGVGLATSGDYRNYFEVDGRRYSHTLNPKTGYPISHKLASVSVISSNCMEADGLATALLVMGEVNGKVFAEEHNIAAFFIVKRDSGFKEFYTKPFEQYFMSEAE